MRTARLVRKFSPVETLKTFSVGDEMVIKFSEIKYTTLYPIAKRYEKKTGNKFFLTMDGFIDGTYVRRDA